MIKRITTLTVLATCACWMFAQTPAPAPPQKGPIAITGATIHVGDGTVIENGVVAFADGKITAVGKLSEVDTAGHQTIDARGKHVYPGFIQVDSRLGLTEVSSVRATIDSSERGDVNPNVRSLVAFNTDSELLPTMRFNGVLTAQVAPDSGLISGSSSIVRLDAWNWEDAAIRADDGIYMEWPARMRRRFDFATFTVRNEKNEDYDHEVSMLADLIREAKAYKQLTGRDERNLKLAAMQGLFDGSQTLYIRADRAKVMVEAVTFARKHGIQNVVLVGVGAQALLIKAFLVDHQVPVVVDTVHSTPDRASDDVDMPYKLPALLDEAGILFCLMYDSAANSRNLPFIAGTAAAYGLGKEKALAAISHNTAKILGVDDKIGSIAVGKHATLFISEGDALDMRGNIISHAFIDGRDTSLHAMQQRLYEKYKEKYGHD